MLLILPGSIGFFSEFRETRDARNAADTAVLGRQSQRMETGMNGRPKREGNGRPYRRKHDATVCNRVVESAAPEPTSPCSPVTSARRP